MCCRFAPDRLLRQLSPERAAGLRRRLRNTLLLPERSRDSHSRRSRALPALGIFARTPSPGKAKTRLIPLLGPRGAAEFHAALVSDALDKVNSLGGRVSPYFFLAGARYPVSSALSDYTLRRQRGADLGERLESAFRQLLRDHSRAVIIGTDSPTLPGRILRQALGELRLCDAVLGPCPDGGFYLIGLRRQANGLFTGVRWGSGSAFGDVHANLAANGFSCTILESSADVDRPDDVERLKIELAGSRAARRLAPCAWKFLQAFFVLKGRRKNS